jgi:hypothetical protein
MGEETSAEIIEQIADWTRTPLEQFEVLCHAQGVTEEVEQVADKIDLFVIDYGGMMPGCADMVSSQIRFVCQWADNHPSKLALLLTMYTAEIYFDEFDEQFGQCKNIVARYCDPYSGDRDKVSAWLKTFMPERA